jgi:H+/Cl- antiporter ClcA
MGLQYFEALSPATIASIVAVLANRLVTGNDVTGYFRYPFLTASLPSSIFTSAIVFGFYGCFVGTFYLFTVKRVKMSVKSWFHKTERSNHQLTKTHPDTVAEKIPLLEKKYVTGKKNTASQKNVARCIEISSKPWRAAVSGAIVGLLVGVIGIFLPHTLFWGEAQLQNLIDKGRTPLPVFGSIEQSPISGFTKHAFCMINPNDVEAIRAGFGIECASMIVVSLT